MDKEKFETQIQQAYGWITHCLKLKFKNREE